MFNVYALKTSDFDIAFPKKYDFPEHGDAVGFGAPLKYKKEQQQIALKKAAEKKEAEMAALPHEGKPSEFF